MVATPNAPTVQVPRHLLLSIAEEPDTTPETMERYIRRFEDTTPGTLSALAAGLDKQERPARGEPIGS